MEGIYSVLTGKNQGHKQVWINEYGWNTGNENSKSQNLISVLTQLQQPKYHYVYQVQKSQNFQKHFSNFLNLYLYFRQVISSSRIFQELLLVPTTMDFVIQIPKTEQFLHVQVMKLLKIFPRNSKKTRIVAQIN